MNQAVATNNMPMVDQAELDQWFSKQFATHMQQWEDNKTPSMTIIATKGTMDMAYPPFILASTAAALGWDVSVFFTFYGLSLLKRDLDLAVTPAGNPAMPMKMPFGPKWFQKVDWNVPNVVVNNVPGFDKMATQLMSKTIANKGVADIATLRELCVEADVKMVACQMTVDLFNMSRDDFIPEIEDWVGAASFLPTAQKANVNLFI